MEIVELLKKGKKICLRCDGEFEAKSKYNRICVQGTHKNKSYKGSDVTFPNGSYKRSLTISSGRRLSDGR